jgi:hypothetical protein
MALVLAIIIILGAFLVSFCVVVMTFSAVETRRTVVTMSKRLELLAERNHEAMVANHREILAFGGKMDDALARYMLARIPKPDPPPEGETTIRRDRPS